jgi:hypothetical protein
MPKTGMQVDARNVVAPLPVVSVFMPSVLNPRKMVFLADSKPGIMVFAKMLDVMSVARQS